MSMGSGGSYAPPTAEAIEAQRLERTRPKDPRQRYMLGGEFQQAMFDKWLATLPRGDRVICNVVCVPTGPKAAKGRKPYHATRVVDRKIWAKLSAVERSNYIDRIRAEVGA